MVILDQALWVVVGLEFYLGPTPFDELVWLISSFNPDQPSQVATTVRFFESVPDANVTLHMKKEGFVRLS